jgi:hypothetical protein
MIQALETRYNGVLYRSRIEARWALFFDTLRIPFEYERQGYDLGAAGWYLPDFWLPTQRCWFEVKGAEPTREEGDKAAALSIATGFPVFVFFGGIPNPDVPSGGDSAYLYDRHGYDCCQTWQMCPACGTLGIRFGSYVERLPCACSTRFGEASPDPRLRAAYDKARAARFDGGAR